MSGLTPSRPLRVLIADDCRDCTAGLSLLLGLWGHETLVAHDGPVALKAALALKPDVVLLDIALPLLNGHEIARQVRAEPGMGGTLLWALTGYGMEADRLRSQDAGFDLHLVKPFDPEELRGLLAEVAAGPAQAGV